MTQKSSISAVFEPEHRWLDARFEQFWQGLARGEFKAEPFEEAARVLHRHIYLEEEILFPEVEARGVEGPTAVMAQEHGEIWRLLDEIRDLARQDPLDKRLAQAFAALRNVLEEHNFKEEQILYPASDRLLSQDDRARVLAQIEAAKPPGGWVCRARRPREA